MNNELSAEELINRLSTTADQAEIVELYRQWAERYDSDLEQRGYIAPSLAVDAFHSVLSARGVSESAKIYDAGCGTGQVGVLLREKGFTNLHGADFSHDMLAVAEASGAYAMLKHADYSKPVPIENGVYDAVISVGVYTHHFEQQFIPEMCRILKPGGVLYFTCRPYYFKLHAANELQEALLTEALCSLNIDRKQYILSEQSEAFYITAITDIKHG